MELQLQDIDYERPEIRAAMDALCDIELDFAGEMAKEAELDAENWVDERYVFPVAQRYQQAMRGRVRVRRLA
jgi:hypothetical protein